MAFTLCTEQQIINKAGAKASSTVTASGTWMQQIYDETVGELVRKTHRDFDGDYASVNAYTKEVIRQAVTARSAFKIISYDPTLFPTNAQWETMLDILDNDWNEAITQLNKKEISEALRAVTETS